MKNYSKKHKKLLIYQNCNARSERIIKQKDIKKAMLEHLSFDELLYLANDRWKLLIF